MPPVAVAAIVAVVGRGIQGLSVKSWAIVDESSFRRFFVVVVVVGFVAVAVIVDAVATYAVEAVWGSRLSLTGFCFFELLANFR